MSERNAREHKDLINKANVGLDAMKKLQDNYPDLTRVRKLDGSQNETMQDAPVDGLDFVFEEVP